MKNSFLPEGEAGGFTEAYAYSVTGIRNRPLFFNVHTEDGALYSRLPVWALVHDIPTFWFIAPRIDPWGVIGDKFNVIEHQYLRSYEPKIPKLETTGRYLFSLDWTHGGFSEDPEQHKTLHLIAISNGQLGLFPNNELLFKDSHFTTNDPMPRYKRNTNWYQPNG